LGRLPEILKKKKPTIHDEAAYVDSQYDYLLKNKDRGVSLEDYAKKRGIDL